MSCEDESSASGSSHHHHHSHDHSQDHSHEGHSHDVPLSSGPADSLYTQIDIAHVVALNAKGGAEAGRVVIK